MAYYYRFKLKVLDKKNNTVTYQYTVSEIFDMNRHEFENDKYKITVEDYERYNLETGQKVPNQ